MPWFNQPKPEPTHVLKIPVGTILKGKNGQDLVIQYDLELSVIAEFYRSATLQEDMLYADCEVRDCFKAVLSPYSDESDTK